MLSAENLVAGYGTGQVLQGFSLAVAAGEAVALMGRNGMGKTTAVRVVMGMLRPSGGSVHFFGETLHNAPPYAAARAGIGLVPEGRRIFPNLTVEENLRVAAATRHSKRWQLSAIYTLFPRLCERRRQRGGLLSGGEQQMLAIGRALMTNPRLLILDEATEGLAPLIRAEIFATLHQLRAQGEAILIIDKHLTALSAVVDRIVVMEKGRKRWEGPPTEADAASTFLQI
jgi:branched-chain amino acid transport system ATP-binding protein